MAIRDIVTRGYGNGNHDPGVNDLPVRGYSIGVQTVTVAKLVAAASAIPGAASSRCAVPGAVAVTTRIPGAIGIDSR